MQILIVLALGLTFSGCYTVILTAGNMPQRASRPLPNTGDSAKPGDSTAVYDSVVAGAILDTAKPALKERPLRSECNCTPFEINNSLCWCNCDRCGVYHRLGYEYCPRGWYYSYYGWDYYDQYPYWYNNYDSYRRNSYYDGYHDYDHNYSGGGGGGTTGGTSNRGDTVTVPGDRNGFRGRISPSTTAPAPTSGKTYSVPYTPPVSSPAPSPSSPAQNDSKASSDTTKTDLNQMMGRHRMR